LTNANCVLAGLNGGADSNVSAEWSEYTEEFEVELKLEVEGNGGGRGGTQTSDAANAERVGDAVRGCEFEVECEFELE
jgi:hypothetical protein